MAAIKIKTRFTLLSKNKSDFIEQEMPVQEKEGQFSDLWTRINM